MTCALLTLDIAYVLLIFKIRLADLADRLTPLLKRGSNPIAISAREGFITQRGTSMPSTTGEIYDLDYLQNLNWCQVLLRDPLGGFIGFVRDERLLAPLATAMQLGIPVTVHHDDAQPKRIDRVTLKRMATAGPPPSGFHYVVELDIDESDGKCKATVLASDGSNAKIFTRDEKFEAILLTAFREAWRIGYLSYDTVTGEVSRGKLNSGDQKRK